MAAKARCVALNGTVTEDFLYLGPGGAWLLEKSYVAVQLEQTPKYNTYICIYIYIHI